MNTRILGKDLEVSPIGLGCMGFSHAYGTAMDEAEAIKAIQSAAEMGIHFSIQRSVTSGRMRMAASAITRSWSERPLHHNLVLADILELAAQAIRDEDTFYLRLTKKLENKHRTDASSLHRELDRLMARNLEIDDTFLSLYTDKSKGILTEQRFLKLTMALENEQKENNARISEMAA